MESVIIGVDVVIILLVFLVVLLLIIILIIIGSKEPSKKSVCEICKTTSDFFLQAKRDQSYGDGMETIYLCDSCLIKQGLRSIGINVDKLKEIMSEQR